MDKACKCEHYSGGPLSFEVASYPNNQKDPSHFILLTPIEYGRTERRTNFHRIPLLKAFIREDISCVDGGYLSMAFPLFRTKASVWFFFSCSDSPPVAQTAFLERHPLPPIPHHAKTR